MTPKEFIVTYYAVDENEFEPQQPFLKLSLSDLCELVTAYANSLDDADKQSEIEDWELKKTAIEFAEWKHKHFVWKSCKGRSGYIHKWERSKPIDIWATVFYDIPRLHELYLDFKKGKYQP